MTTVPFNLQRLLREADSLKAELFPLPTHFVARFDEHTRESYAALLAAMLLAGGEVSANASRLFAMLLTSLGLGPIQAWLFEQANQLDQNQLKQFLRIATAEKLALCFVLDVLILSRLDTPISDAQSLLLSELVALLQVPEKELPVLSFFASKVLGLPFEHELPEDSLTAVYCVFKMMSNEIDPGSRVTPIKRYSAPKMILGFDKYTRNTRHKIEYKAVYDVGNGVRKYMLMLCSKEFDNHRLLIRERLEAVSPVTGIVYKTLLASHSTASENTLAAWVVPFPEAFQVWSELLGIPPALK